MPYSRILLILNPSIRRDCCCRTRHEKNEKAQPEGFSPALAHAHVNVKMIDQGSSELNIIIGVENRDFETAIKAIYDIFVVAQI